MNAAAGNAFEQAADMALRLQTKHEAAQKFVDAATCYRKSSFQGETDHLWFVVSRPNYVCFVRAV